MYVRVCVCVCVGGGGGVAREREGEKKRAELRDLWKEQNKKKIDGDNALICTVVVSTATLLVLCFPSTAPTATT